MTENCLSGRPGYGRTFRIAMWVVGSIAFIQLLALGFGVARRSPVIKSEPVMARTTEMVPPAPAVPPAPVQPTVPAPAAVMLQTESLSNTGVTGVNPSQPDSINQVAPEFQAPGIRSGEPAGSSGLSGPSPLPGPAPVLPAPSFVGPAAVETSPSLSASLALAARENELAGEPILERLMSTGAELRASGNMQGALQAFRKVESAMPAHPRILAELAATLGQMGLSDKAKAYWERVEGLGPVVAAAYFPLAGQQLRGEPTSVTDPAPKLMKIGEVKVEEQAPTSEGQKVTIRVVVDADAKSRPVGDELTLLVYFYDQVAGGEVKASTADTSYVYPSAPYDWQVDGTEEIIVKYNQPVFTEEQKRELGVRSYYGYAIELYYRDQIQDKLVMPENIANLRLESKDEEIPVRDRIGPENALFPNSVYP